MQLIAASLDEALRRGVLSARESERRVIAYSNETMERW